MFDLLWLIPAVPLASFIVLILVGSRIHREAVAFLGVGSVGVSAILATLIGIRFIWSPPAGNALTQTLWTWIDVAGFTPHVALYLDALSLVMVLVVTVIGFFIHLYSAEYMIEDDAYARFFAYMNLFVAAMLTLVLADNLFLLYLGWEGVGLCSYLLIGFWYKERTNVNAAIKAFIVTRIGDTAMVIGLFLLFSRLGTLQIQEALHKAPMEWAPGSTMALIAAALLLCGALGKSAQLPLQTWLPDAMAGPTPVSALIHAATMVTAGVYLIARMHGLFQLAPHIQAAVAVIGVLTLLLAAFSASVQSDIKRVLAYSTISQIGYMFLALGVGAWSAAMFHFVTHACFKSLLFLGAGAVMMANHHERDMFKLGGLWKQMPVTFWTFLIGAASLAALPLVTAGFYSKDLILWYCWSSEKGGVWLWAGGLFGALLTGMYAFRMVFLTFFGEPKSRVTRGLGSIMGVPLVALAFLSIAIGFIQTPATLGNISLFSDFIRSSLPVVSETHVVATTEAVLQLVAAGACVIGVALAYVLFLRNREYAEALGRHPMGRALQRLWFSGWKFDWVYDRLFVRPFLWIARTNREDFIDVLCTAVARFTEAFHRALSLSQTGRVRQYAAGIVIGAIVAIGVVVLS